jgi:ribosomal protein S12 methylthiotransferase accessory factor
MEAIEGFHADEVGEGRRATYRDLARDRDVVDPLTLCATGRRFDVDVPISWLEGFDLLRQEACRVPAEIVHSDYARSFDGYFLAGSNGLASGNHLVEALGSAVCGLVERDAVTLWNASGIRARARRALDMASVDDADCRALEKYDRARIDVRVWNVTTDVGIAAFLLRYPRPVRRRAAPAAELPRCGLPSRSDGRAGPGAEQGGLRQESAPDVFHEVPSLTSDDLGRDLPWELEQLRTAGISRVIAVDLTRPEFVIPVVRVVIPGLEGDIRHPHYIPGPRTRRAAAP